MMNLYTKFEVFTFMHYNYEDMKGNMKCSNWGVLGWLRVTQDHWQHNHSIECIWLPIWL